jgi:hypothetical protein
VFEELITYLKFELEGVVALMRLSLVSATRLCKSKVSGVVIKISDRGCRASVTIEGYSITFCPV